MKDHICHVTIYGHASELLKDMHAMQKESSLCDVKLTTNDGHVMAHSVVLSAASPYFKNRIVCDQKADGLFVVHLEDTDMPSLNYLVNFLYTGKMQIPFENMPHFIKLCDLLVLSKLTEKCKKLIEEFEKGKSVLVVEEKDESTSTNVKKVIKKEFEGETGARKRKKRLIDNYEKLQIIDDKIPVIDIPKLSVKLPIRDKGEANADKSDSVHDFYVEVKTEKEDSEEFEGVNEYDNDSQDKDYIYSDTGILDGYFEQESDNDNTHIDDSDTELEDLLSDNKKTSSGPIKSKLKSKLKSAKSTVPKECKFCGNSLNSAKEYRDHMKTHKGQKSKPKTPDFPKDCEECGQSLDSSKEFRNHMKTHQPPRPKKKRKKKYFQCIACDKTLTSAIRHACHQYGKHGIPYDTKFKLHTCTVEGCNYITASRNYLQTHLRCHGEARPHVCEFCGKGFKLPSALWTHIKIHTNDGYYKCQQCEMTFNQKANLDFHTKKHHMSEESWTELCHLCSEKYLQKSDLVWHMYVAHDVPVPDKYKVYSCSLCDFKTIKRVKLRRHQLAHSDEKNFTCSICGKKFISKSYLSRHMKYHGEKRFKCPFEDCSYACVDKVSLMNHTRLIHTHKGFKPFMCTICSYKTGLRGNLKKHIRQVHNLEVVTKHTVHLKAKFKGRNSGDIVTQDGKYVHKVMEVKESAYEQAMYENSADRLKPSAEMFENQPQRPDHRDVKPTSSGIPVGYNYQWGAENTLKAEGENSQRLIGDLSPGYMF